LEFFHSHKSQWTTAVKGLGVPTQLSAPGSSNHLMSFQQSSSMLMMMTTDQSLFHLLKQYLVLTKGWHLLPDSLSTWILGIS
jgi:hypothetical protein